MPDGEKAERVVVRRLPGSAIVFGLNLAAAAMFKVASQSGDDGSLGMSALACVCFALQAFAVLAMDVAVVTPLRLVRVAAVLVSLAVQAGLIAAVYAAFEALGARL